MREFEWSEEAKHLTFGTLKEVVSEVPKRDDTIALHGGLPPPESFPIQSISIKLYNGESIDIPASMGQQQYNVSAYGYEPLRTWCQNHTRQHHQSRSDVHETMITDSTTHALDAITSLLLNPGDSILIEEYTYCHFLDCTVKRQGYDAIPVPLDDEGIVPDELERVIMQRIQQANATYNGCSESRRQMIPKVLYVIPTSQNPTGCSLPKYRREKIYQICQQYDIYIIEDDPYYYLQFCLDSARKQPGIRGLTTHSFLPSDVDGRVIRLDSFAKFLAPGFRLGWATAAPPVIEKLSMKIQSATLGGNMVCQTIVSAMLDHWGLVGLHDYVSRMQELYAQKASSALHSLEKHLKDIAEWREPTGGLFMVCI